MTDDELQAIEAKLAEAAPDGIVDMGAQATHDLVGEDVPTLIAEVRRLRDDLQTALGALADIANMTDGEVARNVPRRKAQRIYDSLPKID
jgi:hypothetical protein